MGEVFQRFKINNVSSNVEELKVFVGDQEVSLDKPYEMHGTDSGVAYLKARGKGSDEFKKVPVAAMYHENISGPGIIQNHAEGSKFTMESEGEAVVKVGTTYTIKEPGIYRALGMYPAIAGGAEVYLVVEGNGQTAASLTKPQYTTAVPSAAKVLVNGKEMAFDAYTIGGNTYFKLRDVAAAVNGTAKSFNVTWDANAKAISLQGGTAYVAVGGELAAGDGTAKQALPSAAPVYRGWMEYAMPAYTINGSTYFKLRDLCSLMDITVGWDDATKTITVDSTK